jgi:quercetin dioxygenase-like cupin family protein
MRAPHRRSHRDGATAEPLPNDVTGHLVDPLEVPTLDVLGPTIQHLTPPEGDGAGPCVMRGTIPPGVVVPLHSHADPETFLMVSGTLEALTPSPDGYTWIPVAAGDVFHVPGDARHAWRNASGEPAVSILISTVKMGRFFGEVGTPVGSSPGSAWPPSPDTIGRFLATAARYGYWNATPEENAAAGLRLG